jgi:endonuclease/exonuclease/phosphatase family metal-dependent hydrolase
MPEAKPGDDSHRTDLNWLVCTILWMQVDIWAIQESLDTPETRKAWKKVTQLLLEKSGVTWQWTPQRCGRPDDHHIGYLWNTERVTLTHVESLWQFNVKAESPKNPCQGGLRPGHYAWVQSREKGGVDFHIIALHLKSGPTVAGVEKRHRALNQIDNAILPLLEQDQDVVILGDLNTMGAGDWKSQGYELKSVRRQVAKEKPGFQDLPPTPQCTHYFRGRGGWLDHVVVAKEMHEVTEVSSRVTGYCAVAGCERIKGEYPLAYRRLSDHCPLILEIRNRDED